MDSVSLCTKYCCTETTFALVLKFFFRGSTDCCVMLLTELPTGRKLFALSIRIISLTLLDVPIIQAVSFLNFRYYSEKIDGYKFFRSQEKVISVSIGAWGFVIDYPACFNVLDVKKYSPRAPYTYCSFQHCVEHGKKEYQYNTRINFLHYAYTKRFEQMHETRLKGYKQFWCKALCNERSKPSCNQWYRSGSTCWSELKEQKVSSPIPNTMDGSLVVKKWTVLQL